MSRGQTFVLLPFAQMNDVYQRLLGELEFPMLLQGDAPKPATGGISTHSSCSSVCNVVILAGR
jgi:hypothetical protein